MPPRNSKRTSQDSSGSPPSAKYIGEFAINMVAGRHAFALQEQLNSEVLQSYFDSDHPCHIYMICRRPRLSMLPERVQFHNDRFEGHITVQRGAEFDNVSFSIPAKNSEGWRYESKYPFNQFLIRDKDGTVLLEDTVGQFVGAIGPDFLALLDLEVLYVGQAFGQDGNRTAPDRLCAHSTLLKVLGTAVSRTPDKEVWIGLWSFEDPFVLVRIDGTLDNVESMTEKDDSHAQAVFAGGITFKQRINFVEGALIRYFRPEYNIMFKETFPDPAHTSYSECYDLDINSVAVELDTTETKTRLWSEAAVPTSQHFIHFALHARDERIAMFDI